MEYIKQICSFHTYFKQARIPINSTNLNISHQLVFDSIDRQELIDQILVSETRFLLEKVKLLKKYQEVIVQIPRIERIRGLSSLSIELIEKKPRFNMFSDTNFIVLTIIKVFLMRIVRVYMCFLQK